MSSSQQISRLASGTKLGDSSLQPPSTSSGQKDTAQATDSAGQSSNSVPKNPLPSINLPKGGGAIRSIGEKFSVSPATGTGTASIPIQISKGRDGIAPSVALSYDSGSGNGPFGFGWSLGLPMISRKTDKGLPTYTDSDVFILAGSEDLVPVLILRDGRWIEPDDDLRTEDAVRFAIRKYRPRVESSFDRIEKWTEVRSGLSHWRVISGDNVTTIFGDNYHTRVFDPSPIDSQQPRIFRWLLSKSFDDKGNAYVYEYKAENSELVDTKSVNEIHRTDVSRSAQRYLKKIKYGNRVSTLIEPISRLTAWMFEVVFDYGEHHGESHGETPTIHEQRAWTVRPDPFSTYRSCFEIRTYRLCHRILMFHHFPDEVDVGANCLVSAVELSYEPSVPEKFNEHSRVASSIRKATQRAYQRFGNQYLNQALSPVEFAYSEPEVSKEVLNLDSQSLEGLPAGVDGSSYYWLDLDADGVPGVLTQQSGTFMYKRNLGDGKLGPVQYVPLEPSRVAHESDGHPQWMDLAGDGHLSLTYLDGSNPGFFRREWYGSGGWMEFKPFASLPNTLTLSSAVQHLDLTGDGLTDILIANDEVFTWYPSLGENGFGPARYSRTPLSEDRGVRLVLQSPTEALYTADMSGDGLADILRVRNGEICYWPNLGYGLFGQKVTMDNAPWFDYMDRWDHRRIRLFDIDGSGTTDLIYVGSEGISYFQNESGNRWTNARQILSVPVTEDELTNVAIVDLLGKGTGCLVWSLRSPADQQRQVRYLDLMKQKPHLLIYQTNNMGSEEYIKYSSSLKFYLQDQAEGRPWVTRLPFPVHVVEQQITIDRIGRTQFVSRFSYHDGYFDGIEREFRGFGMVEQYDTEEFAVLSASNRSPDAGNWDERSNIPPVVTKTWFHTGAYFESGLISRYAKSQYFSEPGLSKEQVEGLLLEDTILPSAIRTEGFNYIKHDLDVEEAREACRVLKGRTLRQEIYALDGSQEQGLPYSVSESNYTIEIRQPLQSNRYAVFFAHPRESVNFAYERKVYHLHDRPLADPRVSHSMNLRLDEFGNVYQSVSIAYGRRNHGMPSSLASEDARFQRATEVTLVENRFTNEISDTANYRHPGPYESKTYQLFNFQNSLARSFQDSLYTIESMRNTIQRLADGGYDIPFEDYDGSQLVDDQLYQRLLKHQLTLYRADNLSGPLLLGQLESLALPYQAYDLVMTPSLAEQIYVKPGKTKDSDELDIIMSEAGLVQRRESPGFWRPSGIVFFSPSSEHPSNEELKYARKHFFTGRRFRDPFFTPSNLSEWHVTYDTYDLLVSETKDAYDNQITAGIRDIDSSKPLVRSGLDYRLLSAYLVMDSNRNTSQIARDILGYVVGSALMGKPEAPEGDSLHGFEVNLDEATIEAFFKSPLENRARLLGNATARFIYNNNAFEAEKTPAKMGTIGRSIHGSDTGNMEQLKLMLNISYFDGSARSIQSKVFAGPGALGLNEQGLRDNDTRSCRFICNGWTIYNNKGKPVRKYESFFSATSAFEFGRRVGVSPILFYDPLQRVVGTLFPDHSWSKTTFDPWSSQQWDANDTVLGDPAADPDVGDYFRRLEPGGKVETWYERRIGGSLGLLEKEAAVKASKHANTPTTQFLDSLGRAFLKVEYNRTIARPQTDEFVRTRTIFDIQGNSRRVIDALGRTICTNDWDMLGNKIHSSSMESGELWMLYDATENLMYGWDSRSQRFRTVFDVLHRSVEVFHRVLSSTETLIEKTIYGDTQADPEKENMREKVIRMYDQSGIVSSEAHDFKGNIVRSSRRLAKDYKTVLDWSALVELEDETFAQHMTYDAVNRKISETVAEKTTLFYRYNDIGLMQSVQVSGLESPEPVPYLKHVDYNARSQRVCVQYGNGMETLNAYDDFTFNLKHIVTQSHSKTPAGNSRTGTKGRVQDLSYTYDPVDNVTHVHDAAQQNIFFRNKVAEPDGDFTYDALYRLVESSGREQLGQTKRSGNGKAASHGEHAHDDTAMARYTERYWYDLAGNILRLQHESADASRGSWTRHFAYNEPSQIEPEVSNNRLTECTRGSEIEKFSYTGKEGLAGNMTAISSLSALAWDFKNQLSSTTRQRVTGDTVAETTYCRYDARGQRVRKVTEAAARDGSPVVAHERIYFGHFERFSRFATDGTTKLQRETVHVADGEKNLALIEVRTIGEETGVPEKLSRYQIANCIGSINLELDDQGDISTYEEFAPYGDTTYYMWCGKAGSSKQYRYSGKEKDEESGLYYFGARYYLPHIHRWINCDPGGLDDGPNLYQFVKCNPISKSDPNGAESSRWNRAFGALQVIGGVMEIAAGAAGIAAPTGVTQVLGVVAVVHGEDNVVTGLKQLWTGEQQKTVTEQAATQVAKSAGASDATSEKIGGAVDFAVGVIPDAAAALAKHGPGMLAKSVGALKTAGTVLKDAAASGGKMAVKATQDLAATARAVGHYGERVVDEGRKLLTAAKDVRIGVLHSANEMPLFDIMLSVGHEGQKAWNSLGKAAGVAYKAGASAAERLGAAAKAVRATKTFDELKKFSRTVQHHVYPNELIDEFRAVGINIHEWTIRLDVVTHNIIHGKYEEVTKLGLNWNARWVEFFEKNPNAVRSEVEAQMHLMLKDFGLEQYASKFNSYFTRWEPRKLVEFENWILSRVPRNRW